MALSKTRFFKLLELYFIGSVGDFKQAFARLSLDDQVDAVYYLNDLHNAAKQITDARCADGSPTHKREVTR